MTEQEINRCEYELIVEKYFGRPLNDSVEDNVLVDLVCATHQHFSAQWMQQQITERTGGTTAFKTYLNSIINKIPDDIHEELWNNLIGVISEKISIENKLQQQSGWVSVEDKINLPKEDGFVLGYSHDYGTEKYFYSNEVFYCYAKDEFVTTVTHYQPLPQPPLNDKQ